MLPLEDLRKLSKKELDEELQKSKIELLKLRLGVAARQNKNTAELKGLRKYVARMNGVKHFHTREKVKENSKSSVTK